MRKIDKILGLALEYKAWVENLDANLEPHPEYNSSSGKYYYDITANLLWVQKGLCAYTEKLLLDPSRMAPDQWDRGRYKKFEFSGQLEHYNTDLKASSGWDWTNFFVADSDINMKRKRRRTVHNILKPDESTYDPMDYLEYDYSEHYFVPNANCNFPVQDQIEDEIITLGLNFPSIVDCRKMYLTPLIEDIKLGQKTIEQARSEIWQFYTAFEMIVAT